MIARAWDIQVHWHSWPLQLGFHVDHTDPSVTLHLPCVIVAFGRLKQPGFRPAASCQFRANEPQGCEVLFDMNDGTFSTAPHPATLPQTPPPGFSGDVAKACGPQTFERA